MYRKKLEVRLLLEAVYTLSGYDFRKYNQQSILRRIEHRMRLNNFSSISQLTESVIYNKELLKVLLNDFSINVTEMFRDPSFFRAFREEIIPQLKQLDKIRIWHAGCATGEEVYSMAILLQEEGLLDRTMMYATDMNEDVLKKAAHGAFPLHKMQAYTKNYILAGGTESFSHYYKTDDSFATFQPYLSENIMFAQHNLATDKSFQEFDVIICRNVLIYFTPELQHEVHHLFYDSLARNGYLGLGDKETLQFTPLVSKYRTVNGTERIYQKRF
ncbi:CheR family methyltransferase [Solibacillus sp. NPDC093137]|uniref:CheR family methyltransferase n=1 Tax=Solibacillus sp. NPDC093137 TaxID=3390678 RepID=UPI003D077F44